VVFPVEILGFEAPAASEVQIWSHSLGGPELLERFQAEQLTTSLEVEWPQSA